MTRPVAPTYYATDVTGWTPEEVSDLFDEDDYYAARYADDMARWSADAAAEFFRSARDHRPSPREREVRAHLALADVLMGGAR